MPFLPSFYVSHIINLLISLCATQYHFDIEQDCAVGLNQISSKGSYQSKLLFWYSKTKQKYSIILKTNKQNSTQMA